MKKKIYSYVIVLLLLIGCAGYLYWDDLSVLIGLAPAKTNVKTMTREQRVALARKRLMEKQKKMSPDKGLQIVDKSFRKTETIISKITGFNIADLTTLVISFNSNFKLNQDLLNQFNMSGLKDVDSLKIECELLMTKNKSLFEITNNFMEKISKDLTGYKKLSILCSGNPTKIYVPEKKIVYSIDYNILKNLYSGGISFEKDNLKKNYDCKFIETVKDKNNEIHKISVTPKNSTPYIIPSKSIFYINSKSLLIEKIENTVTEPTDGEEIVFTTEISYNQAELPVKVQFTSGEQVFDIKPAYANELISGISITSGDEKTGNINFTGEEGTIISADGKIDYNNNMIDFEIKEIFINDEIAEDEFIIDESEKYEELPINKFLDYFFKPDMIAMITGENKNKLDEQASPQKTETEEEPGNEQPDEIATAGTTEKDINEQSSVKSSNVTEEAVESSKENMEEEPGETVEKPVPVEKKVESKPAPVKKIRRRKPEKTKKTVEISGDVKSLYLKATRLLAKKKYNKSLELFNKVLEKNSAHIESLWSVGYIYMQQKDKKDASKYFNDVIKFADMTNKDHRQLSFYAKNFLKQLK